METTEKKPDLKHSPNDDDHQALARMKALEEKLSKTVVLVHTKRGYIKTTCPERWKGYME